MLAMLDCPAHYPVLLLTIEHATVCACPCSSKADRSRSNRPRFQRFTTNLNQREDAHRAIQICSRVVPLEADSFPVGTHVRAGSFLSRHPPVDGLDEPAMHDVVWGVVYLSSRAGSERLSLLI